jgi:hypothetical protein
MFACLSSLTYLPSFERIVFILNIKTGKKHMLLCRPHATWVGYPPIDSIKRLSNWEVPELLASDIKRFVGNDGPAYGAVADRDGY